MTSAESLNYARRYLQKAEEYLASAQDNVSLERATPAAGDAIHAGINAKDAIVTMLTGATSKAKDHAKSAGELRSALGTRPEAASAEKALRELIAQGRCRVRHHTRHARKDEATRPTRRDTR